MNKADWLASRCKASSHGQTRLNRAVRSAAFAGVGEGSAPSPDHLWDWMDETQRDAVVRMVRAALETLRHESGGEIVDPSKWIKGVLEENGLS